MAKRTRNKAENMPKPAARQADEPRRAHRLPVVSPIVVLFVAVWLWAWLWYGDVFRIARENSFWAPDTTLMHYMEGRPWGGLWWVGLALLQLYRWPVVGGAVTALMVSLSTWLVGYCLRLRGWWRLLQYVPAAVFLCMTAYIGFDLYFETETGSIMGVPLLCLVVLFIIALVIRSFSHGHRFPPIIMPDRNESPRQTLAQWLAAVACVVLAMGVSQRLRPDVRVTTRMQCQMMEQDWRGMAETARAHAELSFRPIAAYYAIALVNTGELGSRLFDIRMEYESPYMHNFSGSDQNTANYYLMDCDLQAGLVQTAAHHAMEHMTMNGPTLRSLKVLTKAALLRGDWNLADKYLSILERVPFEHAWTTKYRAMVGQPERVEADLEFRVIRSTEPLHDSFENFFTQPVFLGYNAQLSEGRSLNALYNSLVVHIYTKSMPQFMARCQPLLGTTPQQNVADALTLMSGKYPAIRQQFPMLQYNQPRIVSFLEDVRPYIRDYDTRKAHASELFPKWKGYYPYYYFFGNLNATRGHTKENQGTSNQGVN